MICRKCGASLPDNAIRCSQCGIKVNMVCPECKTLNQFGTKFCNNCGFELIKICPECGSANVYSALECRKCHVSFIREEKTADNNLKQAEGQPEIVRPISCSFNENAYSQTEDTVLPLHNEENDIILNSVNEKEAVDENLLTGLMVDDSIRIQKIEKNPAVEDKVTQDNTTGEGIPVADEINVENDITNDKTDLTNKTDNQDEEADFSSVEKTDAYYENIDDFEEQTNKNSTLTEDEDIIPDNLEVEPLEESVDVSVQKSIEEENEDVEEEVNEINYDDIEIQKESVKKAVHTIKNSIDKHIIAINGPEGCGKSAVLKQVSNILSSQGYISLYGNCTPLSQITSFGFFQDAFLRIMGFPPYTNSSETFIKEFKKSELMNAFNFLQGNELSIFLNIFYPVMKDNFENILDNKQMIFDILEKVLKSFLLSSNLIITIDNFELLDGASYDFIMYLLNKNSFNNRLKLFVAYQENKSIQSYFDITKVDDKIFETIFLKKFEREDLIDAVNRVVSLNIEEILPYEYLDEIIQRSDGNAIRIEQEIAFLFDINYIDVENEEIILNEDNKPDIEPESLDELIKLRINTLPPSTKNVLFMAAIMGYRFATDILCNAVSMSAKKTEKIIEYLKQELFISPVDNFTFEFKSLTIWKLIYQEAKADLLFKENSQRLYQTLRPLILSSNLQKLISCTEAISKNDAFFIWEDTAKLAAKLGDTNLFVIAKKQCLKIIEGQDIEDAEKIRALIYEQIGKLLYEKSPSEALTYIANVLDVEIKKSNTNKIIDLSGYFIKSCYLTGNYFGASEAVDAIISNLSSSDADVSETDIALIKTRKLKALLNIGNSEQIINLVQEEILPEIDKALSAKQIDTGYKNILIDAWLVSNTVLAKAFALQGNNEVYSVLASIRQFIEKYNYKSAYYYTSADLIEAFVNSTTGNINKSDEILAVLKQRYKTVNMEPSLLAQWNLITVINRIFSGQTSGLKADLFELAAFTNNINEHFIKNIIKLILGYILKEEGNTKKALGIFNEEITYFAKEKVAIGALLSWALIVKITMDTGDIDKALNTATKSLEIAQSPKINNFFFIIYFQKFIAEIYQTKGDLIAVKMYLEKAIMLAKQYELKYQLINLYIAYGKYMEEYMSAKQTYSTEYIKLTTEMYNKAVILAKELRLSNLIEKATKERSSFKTYCQLNSIEV